MSSLAQGGLDGMSYNESLPFVPPPTLFAGARVGFLVAHCFEEVELRVPLQFFIAGGAAVRVIAPWWIGARGVASCDYARARSWFRVDLNFTAAVRLFVVLLFVGCCCCVVVVVVCSIQTHIHSHSFLLFFSLNFFHCCFNE